MTKLLSLDRVLSRSRQSAAVAVVLLLVVGSPPTAIQSSAQVVVQKLRRPSRRLLPDPTVSNVVAGLRELPFAAFLDESYRQLRLRDPDALIYNGFDEGYELQYDRFSDLSDDFLRQTQELEAAILGLLHGYHRESLTPDQQISYDVYDWYLDNLVRGHRIQLRRAHDPRAPPARPRSTRRSLRHRAVPRCHPGQRPDADRVARADRGRLDRVISDQ